MQMVDNESGAICPARNDLMHILGFDNQDAGGMTEEALQEPIPSNSVEDHWVICAINYQEGWQLVNGQETIFATSFGTCTLDMYVMTLSRSTSCTSNTLSQTVRDGRT